MADRVSFVAGLLVAAFGVVLLLDADGSIDLHPIALAPIAAFICGATLLVAGLARRG